LKKGILAMRGDVAEQHANLIENGLSWGFNWLADAFLLLARGQPEYPYKDLHDILVSWFTNISKGTEDRGILMVCALGTARKAIVGLMEAEELDPEIKKTCEKYVQMMDETIERMKKVFKRLEGVAVNFNGYLESIEQTKHKMAM